MIRFRFFLFFSLILSFLSPALPSSAQADINNEELINKLENISLDNLSYALELRDGDNFPLRFFYRDRDNYFLSSETGDFLQLNGLSYSKVHPSTLARVKGFSLNNLNKDYFIKSDAKLLFLNLNEILGDLLIAPKYLEVVKEDGSYHVSGSYDEVNENFTSDDYIYLRGRNSVEYNYFFDEEGRLSLINGYYLTKYLGSNISKKINLNISYNRDIFSNIKFNILPVKSLSKLSLIDPLLDSLAKTVYYAQRDALINEREIYSLSIYLGAEKVVTPRGLKAEYYKDGLKYSYRKKSLCIVPDKDYIVKTFSC